MWKAWIERKLKLPSGSLLCFVCKLLKLLSWQFFKPRKQPILSEMCEDIITVKDTDAIPLANWRAEYHRELTFYYMFGDLVDAYGQSRILTHGPKAEIDFTSCARNITMPFRGFVIKIEKSGLFCIIYN